MNTERTGIVYEKGAAILPLSFADTEGYIRATMAMACFAGVAMGLFEIKHEIVGPFHIYYAVRRDGQEFGTTVLIEGAVE